MAAKHEQGGIGATPGVSGRRDTRPPAGARARGGAMLADTLPPQPLKALLAADDLNVFVLSADPELVATAQKAGGERYPVYTVDDWADLQAAVVAGRCGIALLDADLMGSKLVEAIATLERHANRVVTLVAADRVLAQGLMGFLSDRRIHRLLIKPATLGITRLLIESAVNRSQQLREPSVADVLDDIGIPGDPASRRTLHRAVTVVAALASAAAAVIWFSWRGASTPPVVKEPVVAHAEATADGRAGRGDGSDRFADLLHRAAQAFDAGRLAAPTGDNALDYCLTVLSLDPANTAAKERLATVIDALFEQAEAALLANSFDEASGALEGVRRADAGSSRLAFLEAQLQRAMAARTAAASSKAAADTRDRAAASRALTVPAAPSELDSMLVIAEARIARGALLDPAGDSAIEYIRRAAEINSDDAHVGRTRVALESALIEQARVALLAQDLGDATRLIAAAKELGASPEALTAVAIELEAAEQAESDRRHEQWLALASDRVQAGGLTDPAGESALDYLTKLQQEAPAFAGIGNAWDDWVSAMAERVRRAIAGHRFGDAEAALEQISRAPRGGAVAAPLRRQLDREQKQTEYLETAAPAGDLRLVAAAPPVYPPDAQRMNIEGWVELEFVVDRTGQPKDLTVVAAEPAGRFDQAAITAVAKYRYAPFESGGQVYERRVRLRVRFALN